MKILNHKSCLLSLVILLLTACSKDTNGGTSPTDELTAPALTFPTNQLVCTSLDLAFAWTNSNEGAASELTVATDADLQNIVIQETIETTTATHTLEAEKTYYWSVTAIGEAMEVNSEVWEFTTEPLATTNTIPNLPTLVSPLENSTLTGTLVTLEWTATDADNDPLTYDLYFGTMNPPTLLEAGLTETTKNVSVVPGSDYYWRIDVKDSNQATASGAVWPFSTAN